jgi:hypothetical protein
MKNIKNYKIQNVQLKAIVFGSKAKKFKRKLEGNRRIYSL